MQRIFICIVIYMIAGSSYAQSGDSVTVTQSNISPMGFYSKRHYSKNGNHLRTEIYDKEGNLLRRYFLSGDYYSIKIDSSAAYLKGQKVSGTYHDTSWLRTTKTDNVPNFRGGQEKLVKIISENLEYPQNMMEDGIEAKVLINMVVSEYGIVIYEQIKSKESQKPFNKEALRVVRLLQDGWEPGVNKGKYVPAFMQLPIAFKLAED